MFVDEYPGLVEGHVVLLDVESIDKVGVYAEVNRVIGHVNDPDINTLKIVHAYQWPQKFNDDVIQSLDDIHIDIEQEKKERIGSN